MIKKILIMINFKFLTLSCVVNLASIPLIKAIEVFYNFSFIILDKLEGIVS